MPLIGDVTTSSPNTQSPVGADASETQLYLEHNLISNYRVLALIKN